MENLQNGHISQIDFLSLDANLLTDQKKSDILAHLSSCDACMNAYIDSICDNELEPIPEDFHENIKTSIDEKKSAKKKQLRIQYAKLLIAASITMVMTCFGVFDFIEETPLKMKFPEQKKSSTFLMLADKFETGFNNFAYKLNTNQLLNSKEGNDKNAK